jgi:hypothetical protein
MSMSGSATSKCATASSCSMARVLAHTSGTAAPKRARALYNLDSKRHLHRLERASRSTPTYGPVQMMYDIAGTGERYIGLSTVRRRSFRQGSKGVGTN